MIYFDHVATTPMSREALDTYREVAENFYSRGICVAGRLRTLIY